MAINGTTSVRSLMNTMRKRIREWEEAGIVPELHVLLNRKRKGVPRKFYKRGKM